MDLGLTGKVALVTGGSSGIGRACAIELAREGASVCIVARDRARLEEAAAAIKESGASVAAVSADLSTADGCSEAFAGCVGAFGRVDILVNSAGAARQANVLSLDPPLITEALELKLYGYLRLSQLVIPGMRERGWGRIVNIAGGAGASPTANNLPVSFANVTVLNMTRALSDAVAADGILVNTICPGLTDTPRARSVQALRAEREGRAVEELLAESGKTLPAGRIARPEEIARMACFLASEACSYVHASSIYMDGGSRRSTP
jgi:NAD(P)-dependent dehydrogenase (short-subunit alcohol dehydrogenase family)